MAKELVVSYTYWLHGFIIRFAWVQNLANQQYLLKIIILAINLNPIPGNILYTHLFVNNITTKKDAYIFFNMSDEF